MTRISLSPYLSTKSLLFVCLSVASAVFFSPGSASAETFIAVPGEITGTSTLKYCIPESQLVEPNGLRYKNHVGTTSLSSQDFWDNATNVANGSGGGMSCEDSYEWQITQFWATPADHDEEFFSIAITNETALTSTTTWRIAIWQYDHDLGYGIPFASYSSTTLQQDFSYGFNTEYQTRFTDVGISDLEPAVPPTPVHSHLQFDVEYWLEEAEINTTLSEYNPTQVRFQYSLRPGTDISSEYTTITATDYGTGSTTLEIEDLADGTYDLLISFSNIGASLGLSPQPFPLAYVYTSFTISGSRLTATGTPSYHDATAPPDPSTTYLDCSLTQLDNCLKNAGLWLFVPSTDSIQNFTDLRESISTKFPFNYVSDFKDAFATIFTSDTTQSLEITVPFGEFGNITLLSHDLIADVPLATTIKTILTNLLWIMLVVHLYRRTLKIFNSQETTTA